MAEARTIVKQGPNFKRYSDGTFLVMGARFSYPHAFVPTAMKNDDGSDGPLKYSVVGMMPKKTHLAAKNALVEMINELIQTNKGDFKKGDVVGLPADRKFLKDGDKSGKELLLEHWTVKASEDKRPSVRGPDAQPLTKEDAEMVYGGAWGNILVRPWWQNHKTFGKRVNANFVALQVTKGLDASGNPKPGAEPFGEGRLSEEEIDNTFEAVDDDDDGYVDDEDVDTGDL